MEVCGSRVRHDIMQVTELIYFYGIIDTASLSGMLIASSVLKP